MTNVALRGFLITILLSGPVQHEGWLSAVPSTRE